MHWYRKIAMGLDPNAWNMHENTHRLPSDQPTAWTPWGKIHQPSRPRNELEQDYSGVHATQSPQMAAVYANDLSTPEDPPVVLEILTPQQWYPDIDALRSDLNYSDWLDELDYDIKEKLKQEGVSEETLGEIMDDFGNIEIWDDGEEMTDEAAEIIFRENQRKLPSSVIDYYHTQYPSNSEFAFYNSFILPLVYGQGYMDANLDAWLINQMRFMEGIPDEQIVAVYTFPRFAHEISREFDMEEPEQDEEGRPKFDYEQLTYGSPNIQEVWRRPEQGALFPEVFDTFYHGTTKSRALQALPSLANVLQRI